MMLLLIADVRAMRLNPITISSQSINVQYGLQLSCEIPLCDIQAISVIEYKPLTSEQLKAAVTPVVTEPNVLIELHRPIDVSGLFGKCRSVESIYLFLDQPKQFAAHYQQLRNH